MGVSSATFSEAIHDFVAQNSSKKKTAGFIRHYLDGGQPVTSEDVQSSIVRLEGENSQRISSKLRPIFEAISDYDGVIGTLIQADPMPSALVWGGLKAVLDCFRRYNGLFEKVYDQLKSLSTHLKRLKAWEDLFQESDDMRELLKSSYFNIIRFWARVEEQCSTSGFILAAKSLTSFSTKKLDEIIVSIAEDSNNIAKLVPIVSERLRRQEHEDAAQELQRAGISLNEIRKFQQEEREIRRRLEVQQWIASGNQFDDVHNRHQQHNGKLLPGTGEWLFKDPHFTHWIDRHSKSNVLWLSGGAGVGKSVLCSHAVDRLQTSHAQSAVAFYYFTFDQDVDLLMAYRDIAMQLFYEVYTEDEEISEHVYQCTRGAPNMGSVKGLIKILISELESIFIFLDGLDEESSDKARWKITSDIVSFLVDIAKQEASPLKLWCSSQDRRKIRDILSGCEEIQLGAATNSRDIEEFFRDALEKEGTELDFQIRNKILVDLKRQVNGNFLWASFMLETISEAPDLKQLYAVIVEGLPKSFEEDLEKRFARFKPTQHRFLSKVLSCLAYAKRLLSLEELCEAIEIFDQPRGENLAPECVVFRSKLQDLCAPLIDIEETRARSGHKQQIVKLSHGAVKTFLVKHPTVLSGEGDHSISAEIIAEACFKYLSQPKYSQLLTKGKGTFLTACNTSIINHQLLNYSAKYWPRHMDELPYSEERCKDVEAFVRSSNFITCMQVQSLLVGGQFNIWYRSSEEYRGKQFVRVFPRWFTERHHCGDGLQHQYKTAIGEWGYYLAELCPVSGKYAGQIDRCWWSSLGKVNYLHKAPSSFKSFIFDKVDGEQHQNPALFCERVTSDGNLLDLFRLDILRDQDVTDAITGRRWTISRGSRPKAKSTCTIPLVSDDLIFYRQPLPGGAVGRARLLMVTDDGRILRIGSALYAASTEHDFQFRRLDMGADHMDYIEEVASNQNFFAIASRNRVSEKDLVQQEEPDALEETNEGQEAKEPTSSTRSGNSSDESTSDSESESESEHESESKNGGKLGELQEDQEDEQSESGFIKSLEQEQGDVESEPEFLKILKAFLKIESDSGGDDISCVFEDSESSVESISARESVSEGSTAMQSDEIEDEMIWNDFASDDDPIDIEDQLSKGDGTDQVEDDLDLLSESVSSVGADSIENLEKSHRETDRESISTFSDSSSQSSTSEVYDSDDEDEEYDGRDRHRMRELLGFRGANNPKGPICEVRVFRHEDQDQVLPRTFRFVGRASGPLYASPPVFHPTEDLLVWPLGEFEVLFASFTRNSYFTRLVRTGYHRSCQISVQCRFSSCGRYLHIASLDGLGTTYKDGTKGLGLRLHVSTHRLSKGKPTRSPPKLIYRTYLDLKKTFSEENKLSVSNIPYAFTWTGSHVYLSESGMLLRVYRIPLFRDIEKVEKTEESPRGIFTNSEEVFLPESAQYRKVYFFMDSDGQDSKGSKKKSNKDSSKLDYVAHAILGAHNPFGGPDPLDPVGIEPGLDNIPPQGVHITAAQFGIWESAESHDGQIKELERAETWRGGQLLEKFEKFDTSEDCDIVPYLHT